MNALIIGLSLGILLIVFVFINGAYQVSKFDKVHPRSILLEKRGTHENYVDLKDLPLEEFLLLRTTIEGFVVGTFLGLCIMYVVMVLTVLFL